MVHRNFVEQFLINCMEPLPPVIDQLEMKRFLTQLADLDSTKRLAKHILPNLDDGTEKFLEDLADKVRQYCLSIHPQFFEEQLPLFQKSKEQLVQDLFQKFLRRSTPKKRTIRLLNLGEEVETTFEPLNSYHIGGSCSLLKFSSTDAGFQFTLLIDLGATFTLDIRQQFCHGCGRTFKDRDRCPQCGHPLHTYYNQTIEPPLQKDKLWDKVKDADLVLFTHAHLDHVGCAPLLVAEGGPFYSTDVPMYCHFLTKPAMHVLLRNLHRTVTQGDLRVKLNSAGAIQYELGWNRSLDLNELMNRLITKDYQSKIEFGQVSLELLNAGHEPGSSMVLIDVNGMTVLYTGDFCTRQTTLLLEPVVPAEVSRYITQHYGNLDLLISESTYIGHHVPSVSRTSAVQQFAALIKDAYSRMSFNRTPIHIIIPIYGTRVSEVPLLYEAYTKGLLPELEEKTKVKIIIDGVAREFWTVYKDICAKRPYASLKMNEIMERGENPFLRPPAYQMELCEFQAWRPMSNGIFAPSVQFDEQAVYLIFTTAGMLTGGPIQHYLQTYGENPDDILILTGFMSPNTTGEILKREWQAHRGTPFKIIVAEGDQTHLIPIRTKIEEIHLSHHSHEPEIREFITQLTPDHLFLIHGENPEEARQFGISLKTEGIICDYAVGSYPTLTITPKFVRMPFTDEINRILLSISRTRKIQLSEVFDQICHRLSSG